MPDRLPKFRRVPEAWQGKPVTDRGLLIVQTIGKFRFMSTADIVRIVAGNEDVTYRHLQRLYHQDMISRMALPRNGGYGEFIYYLDNTPAVRNLVRHSRIDESCIDWSQIKANREKYRNVQDRDGVGHLLFISHELMISRFRVSLELESTNSGGRVSLQRWKQGSSTHSTVRLSSSEVLPHRPDAFFTLHFPNAVAGNQNSNFFYEADRGTSSLTRFRVKLHSYVAFVLQRKHEAYGIKKIRAVLIETINQRRASELKNVAAQLATTQPLAAHLFWFASTEKNRERQGVFSTKWLCEADSQERTVLD